MVGRLSDLCLTVTQKSYTNGKWLFNDTVDNILRHYSYSIEIVLPTQRESFYLKLTEKGYNYLLVGRRELRLEYKSVKIHVSMTELIAE